MYPNSTRCVEGAPKWSDTFEDVDENKLKKIKLLVMGNG